MSELPHVTSKGKPRVATVLLVEARQDGTIFVKNVPDGGSIPKGTMSDPLPEGTPLAASLSNFNFKIIKAAADSGFVFQDQPAFDRWLAD